LLLMDKDLRIFRMGSFGNFSCLDPIPKHCRVRCRMVLLRVETTRTPAKSETPYVVSYRQYVKEHARVCAGPKAFGAGEHRHACHWFTT
jgi:hypothetical protein